MARQVINIGSSANDGTGDPLRTAFDKINDNFVELYGGDNDINTLDANLNTNNFAITTGVTNGDVTITPNGTGSIKLGAVKFVGTTMSSDDSTQITIAENIQTTGTLNVAGATTLGSTLSVGTSLALATGATVTGIADEDDMTSNSATQLATQQSIKAYVDAQNTAQDLDFACDDSTTLSIDLDSESLQFSGGTGITTAGTLNTVTIAIDGTVATLTGSQTLTNKVLTSPTINGATMTGNVTVDNITLNDNIISSSSNADLILDPSGTGDIKLTATSTDVTGNASVSGTLTTADITTTGNHTLTGNSTVDGTLTVKGSVNADTFISNSNGDITIDPAGTGAIVLTGPITHTGTQTTTGQLNVDNLRLDGNTISATTGGITLTPATGQNVSAGGILTAAEANFTLMEATTVRADTIQNDTSNGDISISTQGTGNINVNSLKINNLADPTAAQDAATKAYVDARDIGDLSVTGSTISAPSNADLTLTTSGTGSVSVEGIQIKGTEISSSDSTQVTIKENLHVTGNITGTITGSIDADNSTISNLEVDNFKASAIVTEAEGIGSNDNDTTIPTSAAVKDYVDARDIGDLSVTGSTISAPSNAALTLTTSGSGTIELQTDTNLTGTLSVTGNIAKTGDLIVDVSGDIVLDADGGDVFLRDGAAGNYGAFIRTGSNDLTIQSGASQAVIFTGANAAFQGTLSASGTISNSQISMEGNRIKTTASNADLQLETAGTGLIDLETPTQMTVGAVGAATHLPLDSANEIRPVGYLRIKISGTEYVIPYFNAS
jgi:hypothetical protein